MGNWISKYKTYPLYYSSLFSNIISARTLYSRWHLLSDFCYFCRFIDKEKKICDFEKMEESSRGGAYGGWMSPFTCIHQKNRLQQKKVVERESEGKTASGVEVWYFWGEIEKSRENCFGSWDRIILIYNIEIHFRWQ